MSRIGTDPAIGTALRGVIVRKRAYKLRYHVGTVEHGVVVRHPQDCKNKGDSVATPSLSGVSTSRSDRGQGADKRARTPRSAPRSPHSFPQPDLCHRWRSDPRGRQVYRCACCAAPTAVVHRASGRRPACEVGR